MLRSVQSNAAECTIPFGCTFPLPTNYDALLYVDHDFHILNPMRVLHLFREMVDELKPDTVLMTNSCRRDDFVIPSPVPTAGEFLS